MKKPFLFAIATAAAARLLLAQGQPGPASAADNRATSFAAATNAAPALTAGTNAVLLNTNSTNAAGLVLGTNGLPVNGSITNAPPIESDDEAFVFSPVTGETGEVTAMTNAPVVASGAHDLQSFRIIVDRNIFNPNRRPGSRGTYRRPERETRRFVRPESFGLVGTMSYDKGRFAFFDGSSSEYRKVVEPAQTIADYTVVDITSKSVTLQGTNGSQVQLPIGTQMTKQENEPWRLSNETTSYERTSATPESARTTTTNSEATAGGSNGSPAAASGDGESEALKRLLQKREEELKR